MRIKGVQMETGLVIEDELVADLELRPKQIREEVRRHQECCSELISLTLDQSTRLSYLRAIHRPISMHNHVVMEHPVTNLVRTSKTLNCEGKLCRNCHSSSLPIQETSWPKPLPIQPKCRTPQSRELHVLQIQNVRSNIRLEHLDRRGMTIRPESLLVGPNLPVQPPCGILNVV